MTGNDVLRISAPVIAMGGVWIAQRALRGGYRVATGNEPPTANDLDAPITRVIVFAAAAAAAAAVVNVLVMREVAKATQAHEHQELPAGM